ncbi:MAG: YncE family protein [Thermoplasmata archaeon]
MKGTRWRDGQAGLSAGTILLIVAVLLMTVPVAGTARSTPPGPRAAGVEPSMMATKDSACAVGSDPVFPGYDPIDQYVYVPNYGSGSLDILNAACQHLTTITFSSGSGPESAAFDPGDNEMYVTDGARDQVYVISGDTLVHTITSGSFVSPDGLLFDPANGEMAVSDGAYGSSGVTFLYGLSVVGTVTVGREPSLMTYDPHYDRLLVCDAESDNVTSLNATVPFDEKLNINIRVGEDPSGVAFDYADGDDYVSDQGADNVSVITGNGHELGTIPVGYHPIEAVWDQAKLSVLVTNLGVGSAPSSVSIIKGLKVIGNITASGNLGFDGIAYDEASDQVLVTSELSGKAYIYESSQPSSGPVPDGTSAAAGTEPEDPAYDPVDHDVYLPNYGSADVSVLNGADKVVATVKLPSGAEPVAAAFDPATNGIYVTDHALDQVYVLSGTKLVHTIHNAKLRGPQGIAFDPGDGYMAVADAGSDTVTFVNGTAIAFTTTVGLGPWSFAFDPYGGRLLVSDIGSNAVTSMNAENPKDSSAKITIPVGIAPEGIAFDPTTSEDYVADSASHNLSLITSTGDRLGSVPLGTNDPEGVMWDQGNLSIYVANGDNVSEVQGLNVVQTIVGPAGSGFFGITYAGATDQAFVTGAVSDKVYVYD